MKLKLHSPVGAKPISYIWPLTSNLKEDKQDGTCDIIETMKWVCEDLPELKSALNYNILYDYDINSYESMKNVVKRFNKLIDTLVSLEKGTSLTAKRHNKYPSEGLLRHILQQTYYRAVEDPEKLNRYEPFSPAVYGETSYDLVCQMINRVKVKPGDVFIDLGSGVGQVVLQMAAATPCKTCIGIERAAIPNKYADNMNKYFRIWMQWYGKKIGEYILIKDNFLLDKYRETISQASIVFVNNFAFGPTVDYQLKEIFTSLKDGTRIVSSKSFCALNSRITARNVSDVGSIMHVYEMPTLSDSVSWTGKPVPYYLHIIDRSKLQNYFQQLKLGNTDSNSNVSTCSSREPTNQEEISKDNTSESKDRNLDLWKTIFKQTKKIRKNIIQGSKNKTANNKQRNKYQRDRKAKPKKAIKIENKLPPPPDYVDQELINSSERVHTNFEIPTATHDALNNLLNVYKVQFIQMLKTMQSPEYKNQIESQILQENEKNQMLQYRAAQLEEEIKTLTDNSVVLMKARLNELDINASPTDLVTELKETVCRHKELQANAISLQRQVDSLKEEQDLLVALRQQEIAEKYLESEPNIEMNQEVVRQLILRETSSALQHRNKLQNQVSCLENEIIGLEKSSEKKEQVKPKPVCESWQNRRFKREMSDSLLRFVLDKNGKMKESTMDTNKVIYDSKDNEESNIKNVQQDQLPNIPAKQSSSMLLANLQTLKNETSKQVSFVKSKDSVLKDKQYHSKLIGTKYNQEAIDQPYKEYEHLPDIDKNHVHQTGLVARNMKSFIKDSQGSPKKSELRRNVLKRLTTQQSKQLQHPIDEKETTLVKLNLSKINEIIRSDDSGNKNSPILLATRRLKNLKIIGELDETKLNYYCYFYERIQKRTCSENSTLVRRSGSATCSNQRVEKNIDSNICEIQ